MRRDTAPCRRHSAMRRDTGRRRYDPGALHSMRRDTGRRRNPGPRWAPRYRPPARCIQCDAIPAPSGPGARPALGIAPGRQAGGARHTLIALRVPECERKPARCRDGTRPAGGARRAALGALRPGPPPGKRDPLRRAASLARQPTVTSNFLNANSSAAECKPLCLHQAAKNKQQPQKGDP